MNELTDLTDIQQDTYDFCREWILDNQNFPPVKILMKHYGKAKSTIQHRLQALHENGYIQVTEGGQYALVGCYVNLVY